MGGYCNYNKVLYEGQEKKLARHTVPNEIDWTGYGLYRNYPPVWESPF